MKSKKDVREYPRQFRCETCDKGATGFGVPSGWSVLPVQPSGRHTIWCRCEAHRGQ